MFLLKIEKEINTIVACASDDQPVVRDGGGGACCVCGFVDATGDVGVRIDVSSRYLFLSTLSLCTTIRSGAVIPLNCSSLTSIPL